MRARRNHKGHFKLVNQLHENPICAWCGTKPASREFAEIADMIRKVNSYTHSKWCPLGLPDETYIEDGKEYEDCLYDVYMIYKEPRQHAIYANIPDWFPVTACEDCGNYLLPFVWQLTDIWLLDKAALGNGVVDYARCDEWDPEHKDNRAAPYALSPNSPVSFERLFGHRESGDASQAVEEHQREPIFRD